jgi:hypothetical protein
MHFPYLIFYFFIDIGLNSIKIKLLKLNPLVEPSIDCKFKSFKLVSHPISEQAAAITRDWP